MSFATFFSNPFTTFTSTDYSSSYSSVSTISSSDSSPPQTPTQGREGTTGDMFPLLKPVTTSRPVTGTISTQLDTQPRPTIISHRHTQSSPTTSNYTTASVSLTRFLYGRLGRGSNSVSSSGASTPRHNRSRSAEIDSVVSSRESSLNRERNRERQTREQQRREQTTKLLREELEREGFYIPPDGFEEANMGFGAKDLPYKHTASRTRLGAGSERGMIVHVEENSRTLLSVSEADGPYAAERGRSDIRSHNTSSKSSRLLFLFSSSSYYKPYTLHSQAHVSWGWRPFWRYWTAYDNPAMRAPS